MQQLSELIQKIVRENPACVDCGQPGPLWASVNNGVLLCFKCAELHRSSLAPVASVIKALSSAWTPIELLYLLNGGNAAFVYFLSKFVIPAAPSTIKYLTKAADYYRRKLAAQVSGVVFLLHPPAESDGKELAIPPGPQQYQHVAIIVLRRAEDNIGMATGVDGVWLPGTAMKLVREGFDKVVDAAKELGTKTKGAIEEVHVGDRMKAAGSSIAAGGKLAGTYLVDRTKSAASAVVAKGKELREHPRLKQIADSAKEKLSKAGEAISAIFAGFFGTAPRPHAANPEEEKKGLALDTSVRAVDGTSAAANSPTLVREAVLASAPDQERPAAEPKAPNVAGAHDEFTPRGHLDKIERLD